MKIGEELLKVLNKTYEPDTLIEMPFKRYDLAFKTDVQGRPYLLFMGKKDARGQIKGERFGRSIQQAPDGTVLKDFWENKGKAS